MGRLLLIPIVGAFLGAMLGACATLSGLSEAPRVRLVSIVPVNFHLFEQRFLVTLQIQNPNRSDITVRGLDYAITVNDKVFAQGVSGKPITIPAYGENTAEVEVVSTLQRVIEQLQAFGERGEPSLDYTISGHVDVDGLPVPLPFEYQDTLTVPGLEKRKKGEDREPYSPPKAISI
jgi:LEA14-like dessication related protein